MRIVILGRTPVMDFSDAKALGQKINRGVNMGTFAGLVKEQVRCLCGGGCAALICLTILPFGVVQCAWVHCAAVAVARTAAARELASPAAAAEQSGRLPHRRIRV